MALKTAATVDKEHLIVNGHKIWTSNAHNADMMFALLRIEEPGLRRNPGLSFVLIDLRSPGVQVRPIMLIDVERRVNEVLLENVKVPRANLVGEQGKGWVYARYLLTNERTFIAGLGFIKLLLQDLRTIAAAETGQACFHDPLFISRLSQFEIELQALEFMELRLLHARTDDSVVQSLAPIMKLRGCELRQRITDLTMQVLGERGLALPFHVEQDCDARGSSLPAAPQFITDATVNFLYQRSATIAGGTSEIQRNLIAGIALQL
jgi:acyl-CoA dehydrogenase